MTARGGAVNAGVVETRASCSLLLQMVCTVSLSLGVLHKFPRSIQVTRKEADTECLYKSVALDISRSSSSTIPPSIA